MQRYVLAIDEGTTNAKACLVDEQGQLVRSASRALGITFPRPDWVEQDARELWEATRSAAAEVLDGLAGGAVAAIGISNQRESVLLWDRQTGQPLGPCITWQCHRTAEFCAQLRAEGHGPMVQRRTGLALDPMFSASKARWLLDQVPDGRARAANGELCVGTVDAWLLWQLTSGQAFCTDVTNASRTQLFNLAALDWDPCMLDLFGVPREALPDIRLSAAALGVVRGVMGIPSGVPVAAMVGDSHAALFGHAAFAPGLVKATYGTGSSLMTATPNLVHSARGLSTSVAFGHEKAVYALEGNIYTTGAAVEWLADLLGLGSPAALEAMAASESRGVYFVPALVGLGAPHWRDDARGTISGLARGSTRAELARAGLEAVGYQIRDVFDCMAQEAGTPLTALLADGGATRNGSLMQFQADILGVPVLVSQVAEVSALGAAYLAGLTVGLWPSREAVAALDRPQVRFEPRISSERRAALYAGWQQALGRTLWSKAPEAEEGQ